jgi:hypothetical protein
MELGGEQSLLYGRSAVNDDVGRKVIVASTVRCAMLQSWIDNLARRGMSFVVLACLVAGWCDSRALCLRSGAIATYHRSNITAPLINYYYSRRIF